LNILYQIIFKSNKEEKSYDVAKRLSSTTNLSLNCGVGMLFPFMDIPIHFEYCGKLDLEKNFDCENCVLQDNGSQIL
jgi:hypothetical protein